MGTNETVSLKRSYFSAQGGRYCSVLYRVSKPVDMRERELCGVCLMCSIVNKRIEMVYKTLLKSKHEADDLNAIESCMGAVSSS